MPKVTVPKAQGDEITVNHSGDVVTYKVSSGQTSVKEENLATFLAVVDGAKVDADTAAKLADDEGGSPAVAKEA